MHDALLGTPEGDRVRCGLCPHSCLIAEGARGVCGARGVVDGKLMRTHLRAGELGRGRPDREEARLPLPPGCSRRSLRLRRLHDALRALSELADIPAQRRRRIGRRPRAIRRRTPWRSRSTQGAEGVAFTYNEPVIWLEWVLDTGRLAREAGLFVVMVTNGYVTSAGLDLFAEVIDVWRVDVKAFSEEPFKRLCHVPHAEAVREQAVRAKHVHGMHVECVTNVVPTINDSDEELRAIAGWIATELGADTPWHVTRFIAVPRVRGAAGDAARHARARTRHRPRCGAALRLPRQCRRARRRGHRLPQLRRARRRPARLRRALHAGVGVGLLYAPAGSRSTSSWRTIAPGVSATRQRESGIM